MARMKFEGIEGRESDYLELGDVFIFEDEVYILIEKIALASGGIRAFGIFDNRVRAIDAGEYVLKVNARLTIAKEE